MNFISEIVTYVQVHWAEIVQGYLALIGAASVIVKLTPTLKDDDALKWLIKFVGKYVALNRGSTTK